MCIYTFRMIVTIDQTLVRVLVQTMCPMQQLQSDRVYLDGVSDSTVVSVSHLDLAMYTFQTMCPISFAFVVMSACYYDRRR